MITVLALLALSFFALPLLGLVLRADAGLPGHLTDDRTLDALRLSLICSTTAAVLSVVLGTPLAWVLARAHLPARPLVRGLVLLPMVLPPVVAGVALLEGFGVDGVVGQHLDRWFGIRVTTNFTGAVMAATFVAMPFFVITMEGALRGIDRRYEEAATILGATPGAVARRVSLPLVAPSIAAGAALAWARALGEFGATATFAGNVAGRRTLPLEVYAQLDENPEAATSLSLLLLSVSLVVLIALRNRWAVRP